MQFDHASVASLERLAREKCQLLLFYGHPPAIPAIPTEIF